MWWQGDGHTVVSRNPPPPKGEPCSLRARTGPGPLRGGRHLQQPRGDRSRGALDDAEHLYGRALAIKERLLGPEHPDAAITLKNLGVLCWSHERDEEAGDLLNRALAIFERALKPGHP